jgi:F-type H+-transporting ATPase subunit b
MDINLTLISQAVAFAIFIWFTVKFVWPPLLKAIETRQKQIADGLAAGERGKQDLELATKRSGDILRDTKDKSAEIIAQAEKRAAQIIEEAKNNAKAEGERLIAGAKAEIEQETYRAKETLRSQVADLVIAASEKVLRREVDAKAHADLLGEVKKGL